MVDLPVALTRARLAQEFTATVVETVEFCKCYVRPLGAHRVSLFRWSAISSDDKRIEFGGYPLSN